MRSQTNAIIVSKLYRNKYLSFPHQSRPLPEVGALSERAKRACPRLTDVHTTLRLVISVLALIFMLAACAGEKASEMYETAKFEELQNNREHAIQLYEQLIVRYPNSEYAPKAKERIDALKKK